MAGAASIRWPHQPMPMPAGDQYASRARLRDAVENDADGAGAGGRRDHQRAAVLIARADPAHADDRGRQPGRHRRLTHPARSTAEARLPSHIFHVREEGLQVVWSMTEGTRNVQVSRPYSIYRPAMSCDPAGRVRRPSELPQSLVPPSRPLGENGRGRSGKRRDDRAGG
jgi:hypothetical protein